jgi:hypothetical protein
MASVTADNSVEVHTAGGSGDIRLLTATGIGLEVQPNEQSLSIRFSAYRAIPTYRPPRYSE